MANQKPVSDELNVVVELKIEAKDSRTEELYFDAEFRARTFGQSQVGLAAINQTCADLIQAQAKLGFQAAIRKDPSLAEHFPQEA